MTREDRQLLTELALNTAMPSLAMGIMEGTASAADQHNYARRLIAAGAVIDAEVLTNAPLTLPPHSVDPHRES